MLPLEGKIAVITGGTSRIGAARMPGNYSNRQNATGVRMTDVRPYYHEFAWAYDLLQTEPVASRIDFIEVMLRRQGIGANSTVLDAGCGTGRYAVELAKRGYQVLGVDRSPELMAIARGRALSMASNLKFTVSDLLAFSSAQPFNVILCRGVLNDFVEESERSAIFQQFALWLQPAGVLIFDVREWTRTLARYEKNAVHQRTIPLSDGTLQFQSETVLDEKSRQLRIREHFELHRAETQISRTTNFVLGCWTSEEISARLFGAGFLQCAAYSNYGESDRTWSDRLVIMACKHCNMPDSSS